MIVTHSTGNHAELIIDRISLEGALGLVSGCTSGRATRLLMPSPPNAVNRPRTLLRSLQVESSFIKLTQPQRLPLGSSWVVRVGRLDLWGDISKVEIIRDSRGTTGWQQIRFWSLKWLLLLEKVCRLMILIFSQSAMTCTES